MAVVLPALRLSLLLLNLYGTFKTMKPPPISQRSTRNGQGPSARAMQLRKRELKGRLAVWVVWAIFSTLERPLDRTVGFITPFYNEIKCTVLLFLLVTRSHGAEAIFLHLIHPLLRPYVPAIDNILATLHSIVDLLTLIIFLPWEYALHWWHHRHWSLVWNKTVEQSDGGNCSSSDSNLEDNEVGRRQLRPRNGSHQARMKEANRQAQVVFKELDDAQSKVRTRTRGQFPSNGRSQPIREARNMNTVGLRTRKRVLDYSSGLPNEAVRMPGSKSTGVHHLHPTTVSQLAQDPSPQISPAFPNMPNMQPLSRASSPIRILTPVLSSHSSHEIWYPPQSVIEGHEHRWTPPDTVRRTPSPIYPPLPSAYQFTPPPRSMTPPDVATLIPRQVSTGAIPDGVLDAYEGIDQFPGRTSQAGPSRVLSLDRRTGTGESFREALELSIQAMDVDMVTLSTRDGSSAGEQFMNEDGGSRVGQRNMAESSARNTKRTLDSIRGPALETRAIMQAPTAPVRRSTRTRNETPSSLETDEFGFAIRPESSALRRLAINTSLVSSLRTDSLAVDQSGLKPLARTKPALKTTREEGSPAESSDEESVKKRRKVKSDVESHLSVENKPQHDLSSAGGDIKTKSGKTRRKATVQGTTREINVSDDVLKNLQVGTRATRASTRQPPVSRQGRGTGIKRGKRK